MENILSAFSKTELINGELAGAAIIEIITIPDVSILSDNMNNQSEYVTKYKKDFSNLLSEIYQNFRINDNGGNKEISLELLWLTQEAKNQPHNANIRLFIIIRTINSDESDLVDTLDEIRSICVATLELEKYDYKFLTYEQLVPMLNSINKDEIRAIVKEERIENLQNQILNSCYAFDIFPEANQDLTRVVSSLINYPDCAISFQLIPTRYSSNEVNTIERMSNVLGTLNRGVNDNVLGSVSYSLAEKHAQTYKYYAQNKNAALFNYNILIFGSRRAVTNLTSRLYSHINGDDASVVISTKYISIPLPEADLDNNFFPLTWAVNETIINKERNQLIWEQNGIFNDFYRLPYIITAEEAAEFFRLPIGNKRITAGFTINDSGKNSRNYSSGIINGGDIIVGSLKSSVRDNTIGFFLNDLTKHMLIVGTPGSGKTTFSVSLLDRLWKNHKKPFLVIEPAKNEYRALVKSIPDIQVFTPGKNFISPFIFNPFILPKNVVLESYKSTLKTAFAAAVTMASPLDKIFEETVNNCYSDFRWLDTYTSDNKGKKFNIVDFIKCFQETFDKIGYTGDAKNIGRAGYVRLNSLVNLFDNYNSIPIEDLLTKPTIIELAAIENSDQKALIIALILLSILSYVNRNYVGDGNLKNVILLEEAHVLLDADSNAGEGEANPAKIAKELVKRMLAEIRSYGVGIVIADQSPRKVSSDVVALTNIKLSFRLVEARDKEIIANSTNMNDVQIKRLSKLKPGEALLFFDKLDDPEEVKTQDYRLNNNIDITLSDDGIKSLSTYWIDKEEMLKPYPECSLIKTCSRTCDFEIRSLAKEITRRIFSKRFKAETSDFSVLKNTYSRIEALTFAELNDEQFTKKLASCVKMQLLRRVKYYTKVNLTDEIIVETLKKIK